MTRVFGLSMCMALGACGVGRDPSFEQAGTFRFDQPQRASPRADFFLESGRPATQFKEVGFDLALRDDFPQELRLVPAHSATAGACGYQPNVPIHRVSVVSGQSARAEVSDGGVRVIAQGIGTTVLRQEGVVPCGFEAPLPFSHDVSVRVSEVRRYEFGPFPGCPGPILSGVEWGPPPVFVLGNEGNRFIAANGPFPRGLFVEAPNGFRVGPSGLPEFAAGEIDWGIEGDAPVTGLRRTSVVGPGQVVSAKASFFLLVEQGGRRGALKVELPRDAATPAEFAANARVELALSEVSTTRGPLCESWAVPPSWLDVRVESGPCEARTPPTAPAGRAVLANFKDYGRCVVSVGVRQSPSARWTVEASITPP
jgi:hypothetical protein